MGLLLYSRVVNRSLYFTTDKYKSEILRIGNRKIMRLIPPDTGRCWVGEGIRGTCFRSVAMVAISRLPIAPSGTGPPSYDLSHITRQLIIKTKHLN